MNMYACVYVKTLQRQLDAGLNTANASEWCKNCMGMADFYTALQV